MMRITQHLCFHTRGIDILAKQRGSPAGFCRAGDQDHTVPECRADRSVRSENSRDSNAIVTGAVAAVRVVAVHAFGFRREGHM